MELRPVIQMGDVAWNRGVLRLPQKGHICVVCRALSPTFLEFRTHVLDTFNNTTAFVNLPCGHIDPMQSYANFSSEVASGVLVRLILVAEDR